MDPTIRSLRPDDRPAIESILRSGQTFTEDEISVALELVDAGLADTGSDYWFRVADIDGGVAGYICFGPTPMTECTYDLYWIATDLRHRGRSVARCLVETMEAFLLARLGRAQIRVESSQSGEYTAARNLYRNLGYEELSCFPDFYKAGDHLIVFYKAIS